MRSDLPFRDFTEPESPDAISAEPSESVGYPPHITGWIAVALYVGSGLVGLFCAAAAVVALFEALAWLRSVL